jgi:thioredoxin 1
VRESLAGDSTSPVIFLARRFQHVRNSRADIRSALRVLCEGCERLRETARALLGDELIWRDLSVIEHFDYAASLGVLTLPAVAINGRVVFSALPTPEQLRGALERPVARELSRV